MAKVKIKVTDKRSMWQNTLIQLSENICEREGVCRACLHNGGPGEKKGYRTICALIQHFAADSMRWRNGVQKRPLGRKADVWFARQRMHGWTDDALDYELQTGSGGTRWTHDDKRIHSTNLKGCWQVSYASELARGCPLS